MDEHEYVFGANIIENLTTGMYQDSKVIFREYIQNSCDQIDKAIDIGLISSEDAKIDIWLDKESRQITIEDNATGIPRSEFKKILGNIADSNKRLGKDKGFRGIGRLCGLAYCKKLIFTSTNHNENVVSIMECDAAKMRELIHKNTKGQKITASEVLKSIYAFREEPTDDLDSHYFKVELFDINEENKDLLDLAKIKDYLSFVAPVPYQNTFTFRKKIYDYAKKNDFKIDEYNIALNGETIFKRYTEKILKSEVEFDKVFDIGFKNFLDYDENCIAWMWFGLSTFKGVLPKINQMRGIRLRKENIQIGGEDTLQKLFKEDRGNSYFIGEVFAINQDLIPNSQRDYFNENITRFLFEGELKRYFEDELRSLYYNSSSVNSAVKTIDEYEKKNELFKATNFIDENHKKEEYKKLTDAKEQAEKAQQKIDKIKNENKDNSLGKVIGQITSKKTPEISKQNTNTRVERTNKLNLSNVEKRTLKKVFNVLVRNLDRETSETIIQKIEEEFK
jgi:molecular chaperone HtpG